MKFLGTLSSLAAIASTALAAQSFAGSNLYYAAGLTVNQQYTLLQGLSDAGVKVLRVWLDGQSGSPKGTNINPYPALEGDCPGNSCGWNDEVLNRLDDFMDRAVGYGVKLTISFHSHNALRDNADFYGKYYGTGYFYTDQKAIDQYRQRVAHVMQHVNPHNGKSWAQSSEYIFSFETQNEAMHDNRNPDALVSWQCTIAQAIKQQMNYATDILVSTGGGSYVDTSTQDGLFYCDALDVIAVHAYGVGDYTISKLQPKVDKAVANGKKLIMQEWGACYYDNQNKRCKNEGNALNSGTRDANIRKWADVFGRVGLPWQYWQIIPNADPHQDYDYEIGVRHRNYETLRQVGKATSGYYSPFNFDRWLTGAR